MVFTEEIGKLLFSGYVPGGNGSGPIEQTYKKPNMKRAGTFKELKDLFPLGLIREDVVAVDFDSPKSFSCALDIVKARKTKCVAIRSTGRGGHIYFKAPAGIRNATQCETLSALFPVDYKTGSNGKGSACSVCHPSGDLREVVYYSGPLEELPRWLLPLKKSVKKKGDYIDLFGMTNGDGRNNALLEFQIPVANAGFSYGDYLEAADIINNYVFGESLPEDEFRTVTRKQAWEGVKKRETAADAFSEDKPVKPFEFISAQDLMKKQFPPLEWIIKDLIPPGLAILSGAPKSGKSWLALGAALAVSNGERFLGFETVRAGVLYLALEDSERRIQDRIHKMERVIFELLGPDELPDNLFITTEAQRADEGLLEQLDGFLEYRPDVKFIIIDMLARITPADHEKQQSDYDKYYDLLSGTLKGFIRDHENRISVLLVHHTRKQIKNFDPDNPFDAVLGSVALQGAVDTQLALLIDKELSSEDHQVKKLVSNGKDTPEVNIAVEFNNFQWEKIGDIQEMKEEQRRRKYESDPVVRTIRYHIQREGVYKFTAALLVQDVEELTGNKELTAKKVPGIIKRLSKRMKKYDGFQVNKESRASGMIRGKYYNTKTIYSIGGYLSDGNDGSDGIVS